MDYDIQDVSSVEFRVQSNFNSRNAECEFIGTLKLYVILQLSCYRSKLILHLCLSRKSLKIAQMEKIQLNLTSYIAVIKLELLCLFDHTDRSFEISGTSLTTDFGMLMK